MRPPKSTIRQITESTVLPVSLVVIVVMVAVWASSVKAIADQNAQDIRRLETEQKEYLSTVTHIDERLSRIEGKLDAKL